MQTITKKELKEKYGIDLPPGNYSFEIENGKYKINKIYDDTLGCILVGENKVKGKVINSRETFNKLMAILEPAVANEGVTITIE